MSNVIEYGPDMLARIRAELDEERDMALAAARADDDLRCEVCDRPKADRSDLGDRTMQRSHCWADVGGFAWMRDDCDDNCDDNVANWRRRARAAESAIATLRAALVEACALAGEYRTACAVYHHAFLTDNRPNASTLALGSSAVGRDESPIHRQVRSGSVCTGPLSAGRAGGCVA